VTSCAICGCTDERACEGGCFWVFTFSAGVGLCSRCVLNRLAEAATELDEEARRQLAGELMCLAESIDPDLADLPSFAADDPRSGVQPKLWRPGDPL